ncbi:MAG: glycine betaine ABC transporter substrate-binding protein [Desulfobacteraceae bacterium]|nr:glycine betaine ABC transporter substrate-binding protein [Desulfobacteraceae bacterium]MCF8094071.1 glycine betaine ABC transporter substrate-binding protein [Desulfobacteraceae bacterium]
MKHAPRLALILTASVICLLGLFAAAGNGAEKNSGYIRIVHTDWSSSIATANLVKAVFEQKLGIRCHLKETDAGSMWEEVAEKKADAMVSAWLPDTQAHYYKKFKDRVVNLGPNLEGTKTGLVVPNITLGRLTAGTGIRNRPYITVDSIAELKENAEKFNHRIIGIDPKAGIMRNTRRAMEAYGLENDFRLVEGTEVSMVAELSNAIRHQKWIVVTGWLPHWMFARWELKFLDDPEAIFGGKGHIATIARRGLEKEMPAAYRFLDNFYWQPEDIGQLMLWIREDQGRYPYEKALRWIRHHPERVDEWIE